MKQTRTSLEMNRHEKRRIAKRAVDVYMQEHLLVHPQATRRERRQAAKQLRKRVLKEAPESVFQRHTERVIEKPRVIVPDLRIEAEGVDVGAQEKRSPSGRLVLP